MNDDGPRTRRGWLPSEAYRTLLLLALSHQGPSSKGALARAVRGNHHAVTKALGELHALGHIDVRRDDQAYVFAATEAGRAAGRAAVADLAALHGPAVRARFQYGPTPDWLPPPLVHP